MSTSRLSPIGSRRLHARSAFTLSELLIVIALIAVVLILLSPALQQARQSSASTQCLNSLKEIGGGVLLYMVDNRGSFPPANSQGSIAAHTGWTGLWYSPNSPANGGLIPYLGGSTDAVHRLIVCPLNRYKGEPKAGIRSPYGFPYTVNYNLMVPSGAVALRNSFGISRPQGLFLMADASTDETPGTAWRLGSNSPTSGYEALEERHGKRINILWADGHISSGTKLQDLGTNQFR